MKSLAAFAPILSAARHILRIRRNRAAWRRAFVEHLAFALKVLAASAMLMAFRVSGGCQ